MSRKHPRKRDNVKSINIWSLSNVRHMNSKAFNSVTNMNTKAINRVIEMNISAMDKVKGNKGRINMSLYFVLVIMFETLLVIGIAYGITFLLDWLFDIHLNINPLVLLVLFSLALGVAFANVLRSIFIEPIEKLSRAMNDVADGDFDTRLETTSRINEIQEIYANFNIMTKELGSTEILQTDFISNVSHEIKTPINAIEGYTMLLQDSQCSPGEQEQYIGKILFNTKRLSELVGNILLLSKIDNQAIDTKVVRFRADEQIRQSIMLLEPQWVEKEIEFDVDLDEVECIGNSSLLIHVWNNLIGNAIKFSPVCGSVVIQLRRQEDEVLFIVEDCGPGLSEEDQNHIFDKFYQGDNSHKQEGNGLGLALVKRILDQCGGSIDAENRSGGGCRFTVSLPLS